MNKENNLPFGEDINYWQTSRISPDTWMSKTRRLIESYGGKVLQEAFGSEASGRAAFMINFQIEEDMFKTVWPVLPSKKGNDSSARVQAATMLYHDIKAKCLIATVLGHRAAFFSYLMLPNGQVASQLAVPELIKHMPALLKIT